MATLDSSIVNIALSTLTRDLQTDLSHVKWIVVIYFLVITCLLLPVGQISDQIGHKRVFSWGFFAFTLGSLACALSSTLLGLVVARAFQALGAAMLMANGPAIITSTFPVRERGAALGNLAMIVSLGLISGPGVGGFLIQKLGWQSVFLLNVPVGIIGMLVAFRFIEDDSPRSLRFNLDWVGSILQLIILVIVIVAMDPPDHPVLLQLQSRVLFWPVMVIAFLLGAIFIRWEAQSQAPVLDLTLLRNRTFWTANLSAFFMFTAYSGVAVLMPYLLEEALATPTDRAGFLMTAIPVVILVTAPWSGRVSDWFGSREICILGTLIMTANLFWLAGSGGHGLRADTEEIWIVLALVLSGLGLGLFQSPNNNAIMGSVPRHKLAASSAMMATVRNLGLVVGAGVATGTFSFRLHQGDTLIDAAHFTFFVAAILGLGATVSALGKTRGPHWK